MSDRLDWASYPQLADAIAIGVRDPEAAVPELKAYLKFGAVTRFLISSHTTEYTWGLSLWQQVAVIDAQRLIMWNASDRQCVGCDDQPPHPVLDTWVRAVPLSAVVDQTLSTRYDVDDDGVRTLQQVDLVLSSSRIASSTRTTVTDTDYTSQSLTFIKDQRDGEAQMRRLIQFAAAVASR